MTLSVVKTRLKDHLGACYNFDDWTPAFDAVFQAEDDSATALVAVNKLEADMIHRVQVSTASSTAQPPPLNDLQIIKDRLMQAVTELKIRRWIVGTAPMLEDLLNPIQECEIGDLLYHFEGGDAEIITAALAPEVIEVEDDGTDRESKDEDPALSFKKALNVCERFEKLVITHLDAHGVDSWLLQRQA